MMKCSCEPLMPTTEGALVRIEATTSTVYVMTLGQPNGVFAIGSRAQPQVFFDGTQAERRPLRSFTAHLYAALVSTTDDALVKLEGWNVGL